MKVFKKEADKSSLYLKGGILLILVILLVISLYLYFPKDCKTDGKCFSKYADSCSRANIDTYKEGNLFSYEIKSRASNDCILKVELVRLKEGSNNELVQLLQGRDMLCKIPIDKFKENPLMEIKDVTNYCSGPLKEAMLQLTIERLYSVIISNLGNITSELRKVA